MVTSGDRGAVADEKGGLKGLFVAEIVRALQDNEVDLAVHSAKDLPSEDPEGIVVAAVPLREKPFDVLVTREAELPPRGKVGSSSLRRRGQFARMRPQFELVDLRGNVDTRLRKVEDGTVDGAILAAAGLSRLGIVPSNMEALSTEEMVPAPGQGSLAIQTRMGEEHPVSLLDHAESRLAYTAERRIMDLLGGGCALPLGAFAQVAPEGAITLRATVFEPDGSAIVHAGSVSDDPEEVARIVHEQLLAGGAGEILARVMG